MESGKDSKSGVGGGVAFSAQIDQMTLTNLSMHQGSSTPTTVYPESMVTAMSGLKFLCTE